MQGTRDDNMRCDPHLNVMMFSVGGASRRSLRANLQKLRNINYMLAACSTSCRAVRQRRLFSDVVGSVVSEACRRKLAEGGFVSGLNVLDAATVAGLRLRLPLLFQAEFDTGVYPDEMHWREGISRDDAPREVIDTSSMELKLRFDLASVYVRKVFANYAARSRSASKI